MQKAYNIAGIKNPVRDEILVAINSLSSKIPSGMTRGIFVFTFHPSRDSYRFPTVFYRYFIP
ncbi:MAG: hypothetical protein LBK58_06020, partial [Prevotellaceae bacterium]|nr:hypothetical protein [Prevotellaceae bacterium]